MSWILMLQVMILILWVSIMVDMIVGGVQRRKAAAMASMLQEARGGE